MLLGYDISPISASIASFALSLAKADIPEGAMRVEVRIEEHDALLQAWDPADLILMNPPFVAIDSLATHELHAVKDILGGMAKGRVDMAMAFAWKAAGALRPGGVMATVLPAPLLDSKGGCAWREELARNLDLTLLGRFEGYNYFRFSMVETAFLVLRRKPQPDQPTHVPVRVLIAEEGTEDAALRLLRLEESAAPVKLNNVDVFHLPPDSLQPQSWLPLRRSVYELRDFLLTKTLAPTKALFDIRQGARTGQNRAFVLSAAEVDGLPSTEREFFRPAGGQGTLWGGRLQTSQFVFYPYGPEGLTLRGEDDLRQQVPTYFRRWLHPNIESLKRRKGAQLWWALTRPRRWQFEATPKLLSKYFGMAGSFAYDSQGHYAVVQGFAWLWKGRRHHGGRVGDCQTEFHHTPLPWAYLALLNSAVFAQVLRCFCPRVQGGQFDLSSRFVRDIPIPDLAEAKYFSAGLVDELEQLGKAIDRGEYEGIRADLNRPAARVYGVPQEMWDF